MLFFISVIIIQCFVTALSGSSNDGDNDRQYGWNEQGNQSVIDVLVKQNRQTKQLLPSLYTIRELGERRSGYKSQSGVQDFHEIRQQCLDEGNLFEDPEFPAADSSLFYSHRPDQDIEWKRPKEIADNPKLFVDGFSRFDVQQGDLGDCWLLAAIANLAMHPNLFLQVVPDDQSFEENYAGIFHFKFLQYGRWVDIVIDDRLPTYEGQLMFLNSPETNEFWSALLEKAYAKLHGSYEALDGGSICDAMEEFTGVVAEVYTTKEAPQNLFDILLNAYERNSTMGCALDPHPNVKEAETRQGLIREHQYSITQVKYFDMATHNKSFKIPLLRLTNPWGDEAEWNGTWSDESSKWKYISDEEKQELGIVNDTDGEFWISFDNFRRFFDELEICHSISTSLTKDELNTGKEQWEMSVSEGEWVRGVTAGGCSNNLETFWHNPQYRVVLECPDEGDDKCTVVIALTKKERMGAEISFIGFDIYRMDGPDHVVPKPLDLRFFENDNFVNGTPTFKKSKEVSGRFKLSPGVYCVIPSTFDPNEEGEFRLRIFSDNKIHIEEYDESVGYRDIHDRVRQNSVADPNEDKMQEFAGNDMKFDWIELKKILEYLMRQVRFSKDMCRSMIAMLDGDRSGKLGFKEFLTLWTSIKNWGAVFRRYKIDKTGYLSTFDLRQALNSAGYKVNNQILKILARRYGTEDEIITFEDFIMCAVRLRTMIDIFHKQDANRTNPATFSLEEWVEKTLYS